MDLDFEKYNARDIFVLFTSLSPKENQIVSVNIYPSDFGIKELAKEQEFGPDIDIFKKNKKEEITTDKFKNKKQIKKEENMKIIQSMEEVVKNDNDKAFKGYDEAKLRAYELKKLKFYYAVVEFKNVNVPNYIYENYDGMEIERTQMFLEMRFVPDEIVFPHKPKETCLTPPVNYEKKFTKNRALDHSKVKLTWDEDDDTRGNLLKKAFQKDFNDDELNEFIVSSDESEGEEEQNKIIADLLMKEEEDDKANGKKDFKLLNKKKQRGKNDDKDSIFNKVKEGDEIEITFDKGFEGLDKNIKDESVPDIKDKSLFQQFNARRKIIGQELKMEERLNAEEKKKRRFQNKMFDEEAPNEVDFNKNLSNNKITNNEFKKSDKPKNEKYDTNKSHKEKNLDLLLEEDQFKDNRFDSKNKKDYKNNNQQDSRFAALKSNKDYWVDPTNVNYKKIDKSKKKKRFDN